MPLHSNSNTWQNPGRHWHRKRIRADGSGKETHEKKKKKGKETNGEKTNRINLITRQTAGDRCAWVDHGHIIAVDGACTATTNSTTGIKLEYSHIRDNKKSSNREGVRMLGKRRRGAPADVCVLTIHTADSKHGILKISNYLTPLASDGCAKAHDRSAQ